MRKLYLAGNRVRVLAEEITERELYCTEPVWGSGRTVLFFTDGTSYFENDCFELSLSDLRLQLFFLKLRFQKLVEKVFTRKTKTIKNEIDF